MQEKPDAEARRAAEDRGKRSMACRHGIETEKAPQCWRIGNPLRLTAAMRKSDDFPSGHIGGLRNQRKKSDAIRKAPAKPARSAMRAQGRTWRVRLSPMAPE